MPKWSRRRTLPALAGLLLLGAAAAAGSAAAASGQSPDAQAPPEPEPFVLPAPPPSATGKGTVTLRLAKVSQKPDNSFEPTVWLKQNGLSLPTYVVPNENRGTAGNLPEGVPTTFRGGVLVQAIKSGARTLLVYGPNFYTGRYVVGWDVEKGQARYALDFGAYAAPTPRGGVTPLPVVFAREDTDGTLYVATALNGYASEARGRTGYVTALEPKTGKVRWHSAPLVANASTFELVGDAVVCGYGFTNEKDYLYLLNKKTGRTATRIPLKTGPEIILRKGDRVFVKCYDVNYVFAIK